MAATLANSVSKPEGAGFTLPLNHNNCYRRMRMNIVNAEKTLRQIPELARSLDYKRAEWELAGGLLYYAVRVNLEHGGSYHCSKCMWLNRYQAKAARKLLNR